MAMASIDIPAMGDLVSSIDSAASNVEFDMYNLQGAMRAAGVHSSATSQLTGVSSWLHSQTPGLKRRLSLAQAVEAASPSHLHTVEINDQKISKMSPARAEAWGQHRAQQLKAGVPITDELVRSLAKHHNDPYFAAGFAKYLSADDLAAIVNRASNAAVDYTNNKKVDPDKFKQYQHLTRGIGSVLGTATRSTGELALPATYAQQWFNRLTSYHHGGQVPPLGDDGKAMSLGYLLQSGHYSTPFLDTLSTSLYNWERKHSTEKPWRKRAGDAFVLNPHGSHLYPVMDDVMADTMMALHSNPQAAQHFFSQGGNVNIEISPESDNRGIKIAAVHGDVNARLAYMLRDRQWARGDKPNKLGQGPRGSDEASGLGAALDAASTYYRNAHHTGLVSAQITSQTFAMLGPLVGAGSEHILGLFHNIGGLGHQRDLYHGLSPALANMVSSYMPDVYRMVRADGTGPGDKLGGSWAVNGKMADGFPPGMPWGAQLNSKSMQALLRVIGRDGNDISTVAQGAAATQSLFMDYNLRRELGRNPFTAALIAKNQGAPVVENAALHGSNVLGWLINSAYVGGKMDDAANKRRSRAIFTFAAFATELPVLSGIALLASRQKIGEKLTPLQMDAIAKGELKDIRGISSAEGLTLRDGRLFNKRGKEIASKVGADGKFFYPGLGAKLNVLGGGFDYAQAQLKKYRDITLFKYLNKGNDAVASDQFGQLDHDSKQGMVDAMMNQFLEAGYFQPKVLADANKGSHGVEYVPPPHRALKGKQVDGKWVVAEPRAFDTSSDTYKRWVGAHGPNAWLQLHIKSPYDSQFSNVGG